MSNKFSFQVIYSAKDTIQAELLYQKTVFRNKVLLFLLMLIAFTTVGCLFPVSHFYLQDMDLNTYILTSIAASFLFGVIIASAYFHFPNQIHIRRAFYQNKERFSRPRQFTIDELGITAQQEHANSFIEWAYFDLILENKNTYAFIKDKGLVMFIPKRIFNSVEESSFSSLLNQQLSGKIKVVK